MPPPERMLAMLQKAIASVRQTPGRSGHLIRLSDCSDVIVAGDLHGNVPNFQAIWKLADLPNNPHRHLVLQELIHGKFQYPDGADKSHQLVDLFAALKCQYPNRVHYLPGNHEMGQWTGRKILKGSDDLNESFRKGVTFAYGSASEQIYQAYVELWQACPIAIKTENRIFISHTIVPGKHLDQFAPEKLEAETYEPADLAPGGAVYGMLWGRDITIANVSAFLNKVDADLCINGHIPSDEGFSVPNERQVTLDCSLTPGGYVWALANSEISHADLVAGLAVV